MPAERIVFFGNCQAASLAKFYNNHFGVPLGQSVSYVDRFHRSEAGDKRVTDADVVVVQQFDFTSDVKSEDLRPGTRRYEFPMVVAGFLWPFSSRPHPQNKPLPFMEQGPYPAQLGDVFLNKMITAKTAHEEAIRQYLELDFTKQTNLDRLYELYVSRQRNRDQQTGYDFASMIERHYRDEPLFRTPDHPNLRIFKALAVQLFERMGITPAAAGEALDSLISAPFAPSENPVHPTVARHFGLGFADLTTRFRFHDEGSFTFEEFARRYLRYEWNPELAEGIAFANKLGPGRALALLEAGLAKSPNSAAGWQAKATVLTRLKRLADARSAAETAVACAADDPDSLVSLAQVRLAERDPGAAVVDIQRALALFPRHASAYRLLASALADLGYASEAIKAAREAVRLRPGDAHSHGHLGRLLLGQNDLAGAEVALRQATALAPRFHGFRRLLARVLRRAGRDDEACAVLQSLVDEGSVDPVVYMNLGELIARMGRDPQKAEHWLRHAAELAPDNERCAEALANFTRSHRRAMAAEQSIQRA